MSTEREAMTLEQVRDVLNDHGTNWFQGANGRVYTYKELAESINAHLAREKAEPVYQIYAGGNWRDYTREEYEATEIKTKRIVYTRPTAPAEADERPLE